MKRVVSLIATLGLLAGACGDTGAGGQDDGGPGADATVSEPDAAPEPGPDAAPEPEPDAAPEPEPDAAPEPEPEPCADTGDDDGDGVCNDVDQCPDGSDVDDGDSDGVADGCDVCPGFDDAIDLDGDGVPAGCATCGPDVPMGMRPYLYWRMALGGSPAVLDASGNGRHGFYVGGTPKSADGVTQDGDKAVSLDGTDPRVQSQLFDFPQDEVTVAFWVKVSPSGTQMYAFSYAAAGVTPNELVVGVNPLLVIVQNGGDLETDIELDDNTYHHVAFTWRASDRALEVYVDGDGVLSAVTSDAGRLLGQLGILILGQEQDALGGGFDANQDMDGAIDELLVFDRVLEPAEVQSLIDSALCSAGG